ncbi:unnamed protein product [Allacma fusca]|uniref:Beta-ketoacyl synthase-like N-terminal domain-containing protein n=1 Tax=Allacma fusca TaxID=39272 RepID=A0A8J2KHX8_9HEXA|nr:unnamed protein product [Allacma fusca]
MNLNKFSVCIVYHPITTDNEIVIGNYTYEAIVDAGINPAEIQGSKTGVFVGGVDNSAQAIWSRYASPDKVNKYGELGNVGSMFSNRLSYAFNLNDITLELVAPSNGHQANDSKTTRSLGPDSIIKFRGRNEVTTEDHIYTVSDDAFINDGFNTKDGLGASTAAEEEIIFRNEANDAQYSSPPVATGRHGSSGSQVGTGTILKHSSTSKS